MQLLSAVSKLVSTLQTLEPYASGIVTETSSVISTLEVRLTALLQ